jgi:two-component system response regulator MprA
VDDDRVAAAIYRQVFELEGFAVEIAGNGLEALLAIDKHRPDVIVLDVLMPVMDGWEVLDRLRTLPAPPPVVVVSASVDLARAMAAGAAACLSKPFSLVELRVTCARLLASAKTRGEWQDAAQKAECGPSLTSFLGR